ncbi:MAG TPA: hypothetical protein VGG10_23010 [Rhizomicrobium sp.]|jgi:uncharacterized BrkB/YihY/UPF0761 family membrane protein
MTEFDYIDSLAVIVVGLALTNIMTSVHKLVEAGDRVKWHWSAGLTTLFAAIVSLGFLWILLANRASQPAHPLFIGFLLVWAVNLALLFFLCAATLPTRCRRRESICARTIFPIAADFSDSRRRFI